MTSDIQIRRYQPEDIEAIHHAIMESHAELSRWMSWCHDDFSEQDSAEWVNGREKAWELNHDWSFVICNSEGQLLGTCGIHRIDLLNNTAELGYWVRTSATSQGVATEATTQICQWAFQEKNLHRIEILVSVHNIPNQRVAEKAGALREGILKERLLLHGQRDDAVLFALLNNSRLL